MNRLFTAFSALLATCLVFGSCTHEPVSTGGTETGDAVIVGTLYLPDGKTPAVGARVAIRPRNTFADISGFGLPRRMADTAIVTTDDKGKFAFDSTLDTGLYIIEADDGDSNRALIDSVRVVDEGGVVQVEDTLRPEGAISGVVYLSEGGDPRKVFVLVMGLDRFTRPDSTGRFMFGNLAEAVYDLTLISSLDDYGVLDVPAVGVVAGGMKEIDTLWLPFTGIPTPKNVTIAYDTLKQIVTLSWSKADPTLVNGYYVYRRNVDSNIVLARINTSPITDTLYRDSTGIQDQTYEYRVAAIDKNATEGTKSAGVSVKMVGAIRVISAWGEVGAANGELTSPYKIAIDNNGNIFVVDNGYKRIQKFNETGNFALAFPDSIAINGICIDPKGNIYVASNVNEKIIKYSNIGALLSSIDTAAGIYTDVVADTAGMVYAIGQVGGFGFVWKFDSLGVLDTSWSTGQAYQGIAISPDSKLFVYGGELIQVYTLNGLFLTSWSIPKTIGGVTYHSLDIRDVAVTQTGLVYVTEIESDQVFIFDSQGVQITRGGNFENLTSLAATESDEIFGAEQNANRIVRIK